MDTEKHNTTESSFEKSGRKIIQQVNDVEYIDTSAIDSSWAELKKKISSSPTSRKNHLPLIISIAASIALLFSIDVYYLYKDSITKNFNVTLLDEQNLFETENDIILISDDQKMTLEDKSSIQYQSDGKVSVNGLVEKEIDSEKNEENNNISELFVPKGKRANLTFSDGTVMYINSGTRVIYPTVFGQKTREVLVDGEVFLDVSKDPSRPFVVKTKEFEVKVLGTQFDINSYKDEDKSTIVLVSGSIEVKTNNKNKTVLKPRQLMQIDDDITNIVNDVNVIEYISWKDNMLLLNDNSAGDILEKIAHYYGRTIIYDDDVRKALSISGKLDIKETAEEAVEVICLSLSLQYTVDKNNNIIVTLK